MVPRRPTLLELRRNCSVNGSATKVECGQASFDHDGVSWAVRPRDSWMAKGTQTSLARSRFVRDGDAADGVGIALGITCTTHCISSLDGQTRVKGGTGAGYEG